MLRSLLLLPAIATAMLLHAQTYFHLQQLQVVPAQPTTADQVAVHLIGQLSDSGADVQVANVTVAGSVVDMTLVAGSSGGMAVLVPHTEVVQLGLLPAGAYTIVINAASIGVNDMAPGEQHTFTVSAGGFPCGDMQLGVHWHAFADTAIVVHAMNNGVEVFSYPNFILYDAQGDTLAIETVNFFGIGQDSWHVLRVVDGATLPNVFNGTLELWTGFTTTLACSWEHSFELCPPPPCAPLYPTIMNNGGALVLGTFTYVIHNAQGAQVGAGSWELTSEVQGMSDTLCLPPGHYTMQVFPQQEPTGGHAVFSVAAPGWISGFTSPVYQPIPNTMGFAFHAPCMQVGQGIGELRSEWLRAAAVPGGLWVYANDQRSLDQLSVFDVQGRMVFNTTATTDRLFVPITTSGVYLLRANGHAVKVAAMVD